MTTPKKIDQSESNIDNKKSLKQKFFDLLIFLCGQENNKLSRLGFWTMTLALLTYILLVVGFFQLRAIIKTRNAEFIENISNNFIDEEATEITMLFELGLLKFNNPNFDTIYGFPNKSGLFVLDKSYKGVNEILLDSQKNVFTAWEIDRIILDKIDILGKYYRDKVLSIEDIDFSMGYNVQTIFENLEIAKYIYFCDTLYPSNDYFYEARDLFFNLKEMHNEKVDSTLMNLYTKIKSK